MKPVLYLTFTALLLGGVAPAQVPSPTNLGRNPFPQVDKDGCVTFRVSAPDAGSLTVSLGRDYPMTRDDKGVWTATTDPPGRGFPLLFTQGWQTWAWARLQAQTGRGRVWLYYFDQHPDYPADSPRYGQGSPHGQDVAYVFGNPEETLPTDKALSGWMMSYWTNFARTGDPNGEGLAVWPRFTNADPQTMVLTGDGCHAAPVPSEDALQVLDAYFAWRRSQE